MCDQIAIKWEKSHSEVMGWVCAKMAFAILCATNLFLHGSRVKWRSGHGMDDGAGLRHFSGFIIFQKCSFQCSYIYFSFVCI